MNRVQPVAELTIPLELRRSVLREVSFSAAGRVAIAAALVLLVLAFLDPVLAIMARQRAVHVSRRAPWWVMPLVPVGAVIAAGVIARKLHRQRALLSRGRPAVARVTGCERVHKGDHRVYRVEYEFTILSGATRQGRHDRHQPALAVGSGLVVLYDPDQPERNACYPLSLVRTATALPRGAIDDQYR